MKRREAQYVNASEASLYMGVSRPTFYKRYKPLLKAYRLGGKGIWLYRVSDLSTIKRKIEVKQAA